MNMALIYIFFLNINLLDGPIKISCLNSLVLKYATSVTVLFQT